MIYGFRGEFEDGHFAIVVAAPTLAEFTALEEAALAAGARKPKAVDHLMDDRLANFLHAYVFEDETEQAVDAFIDALGVQILNRVRALDEQRNMMAREEVDPYDARNGDNRSLAEIFGLTENDPWDRRTPEQIEAQKKAAAAGKESKKKGELTGDSFKPGKTGEAHVTDISVTNHGNGKVTIDGVKARKIDPSRPVTSTPVKPGDEPAEEPAPSAEGSFSSIMDEINRITGKAAKPQSVPKPATPETRLADLASQLGITGGVTVLNDDGSEDVLVPPTGGDEDAPEDEDDPHEDCDHGETQPEEPPYTALTFLVQTQDQDEILALADVMGLEAETITQGPGWFITTDFFNGNALSVLLKQRGFDFKVLLSKEHEPNEKVSRIVQRQMFAMYFRLDCAGLSIEQVVKTLDDAGVRRDSILGRGEYDTGAFVVCTVERVALDNAERIKAAHEGVETTVYAVHGDGSRMAPEGVTVLDPNATPEIGPRPWDDDTSAWDALSEDERAEEIKKIRADEFIITGSYEMGKGSIVYVTPHVYFKAHGDMWQGDLDPYVAHLLLKSMKREDVNAYRDRHLDFDTIVFQLGKKGFKDSIMFRMWMNSN